MEIIIQVIAFYINFSIKKQWFDSLGNKFITAEAVKSGAELGICKRMVMYMLADLKEKNIINKLQQGEYEKVQK